MVEQAAPRVHVTYANVDTGCCAALLIPCIDAWPKSYQILMQGTGGVRSSSLTPIGYLSSAASSILAHRRKKLWFSLSSEAPRGSAGACTGTFSSPH